MNEKDNLRLDSRPNLRNPYIICGLNGWGNSGDVAIGGIDYLIRQFKARKFAEMPASRYHLYQIPGVESIRPVFKMQEGLITEVNLPGNQFYYALNPASDHDLILFKGTEPNLSWEEYAENVVSLACDFGASGLYAFGGLLERIPYNREPRISCTCTSAKVKDDIDAYNVTFSNREGPATFNQMLVHTCQKKGLEAVGFTVRVPCYPECNVAIEYSPRSIKAVFIRLNHIMHLNMDFEELNGAIKELEGKLDFVRQQNQQFKSYIEELEKDYVEMAYQEPLDISPNEAIRFAEEFLKNNNDRRPEH